ncbi:MAG: hypothetical protein M3R38_14600 [Actinomycetota bacterium]|nr:hypothetical protein [Actinomycetota bacterium]
MGPAAWARIAACGRRIRAHQPDVLLEELGGGGKPLAYHERCSGAAYEKASERPGVVRVLTIRSVDARRN